ncbi:MAG: GntR family transcriptional regulator [Actinomycetota bacterium]|nr:GntR family transcriptional regulator [Actinomycetota bacterium]
MAVAADRSIPLPLWAQVAEDLKRRLAEGGFEEHFPTDDQLCAYYGVSRHTAREAVRQLSAEGLVRRQRGRPTSVSRPVVEQSIHSIYSLASTVRGQGLVERSEILTTDRRPVTPEAAAQLRVDEGDEVVYVERLRYAGSEPIAWDRSWLPAELAAPLLGVDLSSGGLYEALSAHCSLRVTGGSERIVPLVSRPAERRLLRMPSGVATFSVERLVLSGSTPIEWRRSLIRGDRYCLVAQWPSPARG